MISTTRDLLPGAPWDRRRPNPAPPGILLVDDHELVRLGFRALVEAQAAQASHAPLEVHEAATLADALARYREHGKEISVVVLDLALPDADGLHGLMVFREAFPDAVVVVLSGTRDDAVARNALALGALAFFPKSGDLADMLEFVRTCALHGAEAALQMAPRPLPAMADVARLTPGHEFHSSVRRALTTRQLQILKWLLEGKSNREISTLACLSEGTVKNHVSMLLLSFAVRSRAQLISKLRP